MKVLVMVQAIVLAQRFWYVFSMRNSHCECVCVLYATNAYPSLTPQKGYFQPKFEMLLLQGHGIGDCD